MKNSSIPLRLLFILHRTPPTHGAAKVGDLVYDEVQKVANIDANFITIHSSEDLKEIGKITARKFLLFFYLAKKLILSLFFFRPDVIYYTPSVSGVALYRDIVLSFIWKLYCVFYDAQVYYHFHQRGIDKAAQKSKLSSILLNWFQKDVTIIAIGPNACQDFDFITTKKKAVVVQNAVQDISKQVKKIDQQKSFYDILYLSNMIKDKGYFRLLELAPIMKDKGYKFHFAGSWVSKSDELEFFDFVEKNDLSDCVFYHGFADNDKKIELFTKADLFVLPTRYKLESAPLCLIEALSFGVPCISTKLGDIPSMVPSNCGIVLDDLNNLHTSILLARQNLYSETIFELCRLHYQNNYSPSAFRKKLIKVLCE